jgi:CheY-like chemotaxis protein
VQVQTQFPLGLPQVNADENQLELALLNLSVNARDAMRDGGPLLISAREQSVGPGHETRLPAGQYVCLAVTDQGEGMSEETLSRATEPFFTTKGVGKGTGLGLSMVHGMSEQMGGRLLLKSRKGHGTTAEVWLPTATADPVKAKSKAVGEAVRGRSLNVLAVDDDALVLFNTVAMLEDLGHRALQASSGAAALEILRHSPVDLIITDQAMPTMTGTQLIEAVKSEWPQVRAILATGYAELPDDGQVDVPKLNKPFTEQELAWVLALSDAERPQPNIAGQRLRLV